MAKLNNLMLYEMITKLSQCHLKQQEMMLKVRFEERLETHPEEPISLDQIGELMKVYKRYFK